MFAILFAVVVALVTLPVIPAGAQTVSAVTLTNGPPNIPNTSPCTPTTCAWIGAGWPSGTHVSLVYADLTPISADYAGTFALSDQAGHAGDAAHFSVSTSSVGYTDSFNNAKSRNVGEIKTNGTVAAGDYFITVTANGASGSNTQNVTVHAASGTHVACGAAVPTRGTVLLSPNCTYTNVNSLVPSAANTVYIGAGNGGTKIDGNNSFCSGIENTGGYPGSPPGIAVIGIQFQNFGVNCVGLAAVHMADNSVTRNSRFVNIGASGVAVIGNGNFVANNYVNHTGYAGIGVVQAQFTSGTTAPIVLIGNEISDTNYLHYDPCNDVNSTKIIPQYGSPPAVSVLNSYYHDNASNGPWYDTWGGSGGVISGNTHVRDGISGSFLEQSRNGITIDHNVFVHEGDGSAPTALSSGCGGESLQGPAIWIQGSANINAHDNNMSIFTVFDPILGANKSGQAFSFYDETGNGTGFVGNNTLHDNTVNWFTNDSGSVWGWSTSTEDTSGSSSNNNHFHLVGGNTSTDAHWYWSNQGDTAQTWATYRSSGQDANSTIDTTDTSTTGCTHLACSGSGVGAGGVPLRPGIIRLFGRGIAFANYRSIADIAVPSGQTLIWVRSSVSVCVARKSDGWTGTRIGKRGTWRGGELAGKGASPEAEAPFRPGGP